MVCFGRDPLRGSRIEGLFGRDLVRGSRFGGSFWNGSYKRI